MERILPTNRDAADAGAISFEKAVAEYEKEQNEVEETSCRLQLKNLIKTNIKLLKLNDFAACWLL